MKFVQLSIGESTTHGRPQMGSADPLKKWMKNTKAKTCKKEQFSMFMLYFESNQGRQV